MAQNFIKTRFNVFAKRFLKNTKSPYTVAIKMLQFVSGGGGRHGSDSAVGSSATLSGDQPPSSPPSWASSPPASPDSAVTAVSYIPEPQQPAPQQQVLQRVSFTTSSELRQITRSTSQQEAARATIAPPHTPSITSIGGAVMR